MNKHSLSVKCPEEIKTKTPIDLKNKPIKIKPKITNYSVEMANLILIAHPINEKRRISNPLQRVVCFLNS